MQNEILGDRYQLQDPIGRGGMATIYRGRDTRMERTVAIKVLREVYSTDPKFVTRFQREAKAASALQHPNIVQVFDYGQSDGSYFIVMELIEGLDLRRYLRSRGVLDIDRSIIIAHDVALGLGAAHRRGIVHRDVKPQNVLVGRDGSIKLTDFGIASVYKDINAERLTTTGMTLGTVQYYAPEQAQGEIVSPAADVYALGIVIYEMLTGRTPFDGDTPVAVAMQHIQDTPIPPTQYNPNIPQVLEDIIMRCLEKVPEMRYRDGSTLARALEVLGEEEMGEQLPPKLSSGGLKTAGSGATFGAIPQRPQYNNPRVPNEPQPIELKDASSVNNNAPAAYVQNSQSSVLQSGMLQNDMANGATIANNPNQLNDLANAPVAPNQATYSANGNGRGHSMPGFGQNAPMQDYAQPPASPYYVPPNGISTQPFQRGTVPRSGVVQQDQRESRFGIIMTALIVLATLLLLGLAVFLAFHIIPGLSGGDTPTATPTSTPLGTPVPSLIGKSYKEADALARKQGFTLALGQGTSTSGVVINQNPKTGQTALKGSTISVTMGPNATPVATATIPDNLASSSVTDVENALSQAGFTNYVLINAGANPNDTTQETVKGTDPAAGDTVAVTKQIKIYVYNCTAVVCALGTPFVAPSASPTAVPTATAQPSPTPTATTQPSPTPTATPLPTPTATPLPTPTATPPQTTPTPTLQQTKTS